MNTRMDRKKLNISTYILQPYARTRQHIADLSACGIDFVICVDYDIEMLDLFAQYGMGAVVSGLVPGWFGGQGENAGKLAECNPLWKYDEAIKGFKDHPAIWGIDVGDEPSVLEFPHYGKVIQLVDEAFKDQFAYLNLYPNYGMLAKNTEEEIGKQLGTDTYEQYIDQYCRNVPTDYISCDFYPYSRNIKDFYDNLRVVSDACRKHNKDFWIVLQVNSHREDATISINQLRFQAFSAMAFGAEAISWACYTAGWWYHQVLDEKGKKTPQYEKLKQVNREIKTIADEYMRYRNIATYFVGAGDNSDFADMSFAPMEVLRTDIFNNVKEKDGKPLLVGEMISREDCGKRALMICPVDDPMDRNPQFGTLEFCVNGNYKIRAWNGDGELKIAASENGLYCLQLTSNNGVFITAE